MTGSELWWQTAFTLWGAQTSWAEVLAFVLSLWMVERNIKVSAWGWPLAIISALIYAQLFKRSNLYGEAALQLLFIAVSAWGWWQWRYGKDAMGQALVVRRLGRQGRWTLAGLTLLGWPLLGTWLAQDADSTVPYVDALATAGSVAGQWLLGRKYLENWPVWVAVNVFSVGLFVYKQLWLTALLYALFAVLALVGWRAWHGQAARQVA